MENNFANATKLWIKAGKTSKPSRRELNFIRYLVSREETQEKIVEFVQQTYKPINF